MFFSHYYAKIKVDSYDSLPLEKMLTLHVITHNESNLNKDQNHHYYNIFLQKFSYQSAKMCFFNSTIMLRFGETKVAKENLYDAKIYQQIIGMSMLIMQLSQN